MLTSERFIKSYAKRPYQHATLVNHKGTLISFAMDTEGRIYYTTLNLEDTSRPDPTDSIYWSDDPVELLFPRELVHFGVDATPRTLPLVNQGRQAESPGTTLPADDQDTFLSSTARLTANAPFQVLSDGEYIYLFRQAIAANHPAQIFTDSERSSPLVNSTLLLDRFVLLGTTLQRKQEIRYQRSRNKFHPANEKDNLGAKDMEGNIFYEPTQALEFVGGLNHGRFYVLLLPTQQAEVRRWQIFVHNTNTQQIDSINVQQSPDGLFHIDNPSFPIHRFSFAFQGRSLVSGLSALLYYQQEKSKTGYDQQEKPLKRDARVMLAIATQTATHNRSEIAVVDFGVSSTGTLAQIPQSIQLPALQKPSTGGENSSNDQLDRIVERSEEAKALEREIQRINLTIDELNRQIEVLNRPKQATLYNEANSQGYFFNQTSSEGQKSSFIQIKSIKVAANSVVSVSARKIFDAAGRPLSNQPEIQIVQNAKDVPNLALPGDYGYVDTDPRPNSWQPQRNYELIVTVNTEASVAAQLQVLQNNLADQQNTLRSKENDLSQCLEAIAALKASVQNEIRLTMPLLQVDENGLSVSGAVLEFAWTKDTPQLFGSAAGQIGLYFRGENDQFFVAYYDTLTAKAQFKLPNSEVVFMAQSDQPEMDHLTLTVSAAATSQECQVDIRGGGITETWQRLPRDPQAFANILNGAASDPVYIGTLATQITANTTLTSLSLTPVLSMEMSDRGVLLLNDQTLNLTQSLRLGLEGTTTFPSQTVAIASTRFPQGIPANTPVYFRPYDYNRLVTSTPSPSSPFNTSLNNGSRLIRVNQGNSKENIPNGTASSLGSTLNCHWSANNPGNALQLDGQQTYAMLPTAQVSQMDAIQDVSLETWVKPDQVVGTARMIHQISNQSRYTLGLTQLPLGSRAFRFDTADDAIALPTSLHLDRRDFTVEAWIKFDSLVSQQPILMMMLPATNRVSNEFLHLMVRNRKAYLGFYDDDLAGERTLNENTWYHIAWRYTHATQEQAIFINGELDTKKIASGSLNSKRQLFFGKPWDAGMVAFRGAMDELRIWSTARSEDQIKATLNQRIRGTEAGLLGCWRYDFNNNAITAQDYSPHQNHGILEGSLGSTDPALPAAYTFFAGVRQQFRQAEARFFCGDWQHLAIVFNQSYGVQFNGLNSVINCGNNTVLDLCHDLTLEVFCLVENINRSQVLLSRGIMGDDGLPYSLAIDRNGKILYTHLDATGKQQSVSSNQSIPANQFCRIAVTRRLKIDAPETKSAEQTPTVTKEWVINLYLNGQPVGSRTIEGKEIKSSNANLLMGKYLDQPETSASNQGAVNSLIQFLNTPFQGVMSEVRIWNTARAQVDIANPLKGNETGLVAWWCFEENGGTVTEDRVGKNTASMKSCQWVISPDPEAAALKLYSNGVLVQSRKIDLPDSWNSDSSEFSLGGRNSQASNAVELFKGSLEETRIWRTARTPEQIQDNLYRRLLDEREDLLAYYTFDAESATELKDQSFAGNHLRLPARPTGSALIRSPYIFSDAPISEDIPQVRSALAGIRTRFHDIVQSQPSVQEYGDVQYDSNGQMIGIFKRCYCYIKNDRWELLTGFKVGDLVTEWIGQVQFDPQLSGFIEGAPPVPSENLTDSAADYRGASTIELTEAQETTYTYASSRERGFELSVETSLTAGFKSKTALSKGVGLAVVSDMEDTAIVGGVKSQWENSQGWLDTAEASNSKTTSKLSQMSLQGNWENSASRAIGKRFIPMNVGFALVQSETADVFALRLKHNQALVSFRMQPNPDIPKDWNIITFPLNPLYVKQGTLDGKVGFEPDPSYPQAMGYSNNRSYFKPREAYSLKQQIQREEEQRKIKYDNYRAGDLGRKATYSDEEQRKFPRLEKRNLVNTYVWTVEGGLFAETQETMDVLQESTGGSYSFKGMGGMTMTVGLNIFKAASKFTLDAMAGGFVNHQHTKTSQSSTSFGLNVALNLETNITQQDANGHLIEMTGLPDSGGTQFKQAPGKVDAYRFMTFYLEPQSRHFEEFFNQVVDPIWLNQSRSPNAMALRKTHQEKQKPPCWRVLHRVTYVSRVLPDITSSADQPTTAPALSSLEKAIQALGIKSLNEFTNQLEPLLQNHKGSYPELSQAIDSTIRISWPALKPLIPDITKLLADYLEIPIPTSVGA